MSLLESNALRLDALAVASQPLRQTIGTMAEGLTAHLASAGSLPGFIGDLGQADVEDERGRCLVVELPKIAHAKNSLL